MFRLSQQQKGSNMGTALFPLNAVLCPGGRLPLRIFEARYLDMIARCLREGEGFVVVLMKPDTNETVENPFYQKGTMAKIVDFDSGDDGLLNITVEGIESAVIKRAHRDDTGLWVGDIEFEGETKVSYEAVPVPNQFEELAQILKALVRHPSVSDLNLSIDFDDSRQVGLRLTELLPLDNTQKQYLFELDDPIFRLEKISDQLSTLAP